MDRERELEPVGGWRSPGRERIGYAERRQGAVSRFVGLGSRVIGRLEAPNVFRMLQTNARIFFPWLAFASQLMPFGRLDPKDRERVILRVAWNCRSRYEWGQHVAIATRVGVPDDEIRAIAEGPDATLWAPLQRAILRACDEFHHDRMVAEPTWRELASRLDEELLVELLLLVGHYEMLAGVLNTTGVRLEPHLEPRLRELAT